jgi:D-allose transport system substrate-binding protein
MKPITRAVAMTMAALTTVVLAACSSGTTSTTGGAAAGAPKYALILKTLSSEFWQNMKTGAEEEAKKQGVTLDVFAANSEDDVEGQVTLLQNAIGKGYKAIGVAPISAVNMNNAVAQASWSWPTASRSSRTGSRSRHWESPSARSTSSSSSWSAAS